MSRLVIALLIAAASASIAHSAENTEYGGWKGLTSKSTGFFRVEKNGDRWWCFDPSGAAFYAIGTDHCNYNVHWCEALKYAPYAQNVRKKYNNDESAWAKSATDRLKQWGFNALGANNSPSTRGRGLAYMGFLGMGSEYAGKDSIVPKVHWTGFPNVFNPAFVKHCEEKAQKECAPSKDDPWLFGWFIDNELEWFGKDGSDTGVATEAIKCPATNEGKQALVKLLRTFYSKIEEFNATWGTNLASWDDALASTEWKEQANGIVVADKIEFLRLCADRYFAITTAAIRKADPNHMILGCRFAGNAPPVWDIAGEYCDIVSFNIYGQVDLERLVPIDLEEILAHWHMQCRRPMMCTEWSFPALDAGLPSVHGAGMRVRTQADKAKCFEVYQKTFFSLPFMVGSDYFMWVDEPALGIHPNFTEDSNYGLVDVNDDAWPVFTEAVARVNPLAYDIHTSKTAEVVLEKAWANGRSIALKAKNTGVIPARTSVVIEIDGRKFIQSLDLPVGSSKTIGNEIDLAPGAHYVQAQIDPDGKLVEVNRGDNKLSQFVYIGRTPSPSKGEGRGEGHSSSTPSTSKGEGWGEGGIPIGIYSPEAPVKPRLVEGIPFAESRPITIPLSKLAGSIDLPKTQGLVLTDGSGNQILSEILDLDDSGSVSAADELVFSMLLCDRKCETYFLQTCRPGQPGSVRLIKPSDMSRIDYATRKLQVSLRMSTPTAIDSIKLGDLEMGSLDALIMQVAGGTWWQRPNKCIGIRRWDGDLCNRFEVTLANTVPADSVTGPFGYEAKYALSFYPGRSWFTAQFLSLKNTDSRSWKLGSYFYHPNSTIGGSSEGDEPDPPGISGTAAWTDQQAGASYGIVGRPVSGLEVYFWKDPEGREHSDARVKVGKMLEPGQTYSKPGVPVYLFCARTKDHPQPWLAMEQEIDHLPKWEVF